MIPLAQIAMPGFADRSASAQPATGALGTHTPVVHAVPAAKAGKHTHRGFVAREALLAMARTQTEATDGRIAHLEERGIP